MEQLEQSGKFRKVHLFTVHVAFKTRNTQHYHDFTISKIYDNILSRITTSIQFDV